MFCNFIFFKKCEPFGFGNREPVWKLSDLQVMNETSLVGDGNHLKLFFQDTRGNVGQAIAFNWPTDITPDDLFGRVVDLAVNVKKNTYMGETFPEIRVVDLKFA